MPGGGDPAPVLTKDAEGPQSDRGRFVPIALAHGSHALRQTHKLLLIDSAAFVNWRRIEAGARPIVALSYR